jgi:hypothetical protein
MNNCCCGNIPLEIKIKKGESIPFVFRLLKNGAPIDLTGASLLLQVRDDIIDDGNFLISKIISENSDEDEYGKIIDPVAGQFAFKINKEDIDDMSTTKPYFAAIYLITGDICRCISANSFQSANFLVINP